MSIAEVLPWEVEEQDDPRAEMRTSRWRWLGFVRHLGLPISLIVLIVAGIRYVPVFRYEMNPDGCSYMNIAKQYLDGNFWDAVNAYWSPLISWLLIPFMVAGIDAPLATKILSVIVGGGVICSAWCPRARVSHRMVRGSRRFTSPHGLICATTVHPTAPSGSRSASRKNFERGRSSISGCGRMPVRRRL